MATLIEKTRSGNITLLPSGYVELLARSNFSFLQGASHPEEMVEEAMRLEYSGIALADLGGMYGVARGFNASRAASAFTAGPAPKENFRYLVGAEVILTNQMHLVLIPRNKEAYSRLCHLLTLGKRNVQKYFSRIELADVLAHANDLIALALPPWTDPEVDRALELLQKAFGSDFYLPVWRDLTWESLQFCQKAFELEHVRGFQLVATQRAWMHRKERKSLFDVLTCIHHHTTLFEAKDILIQNGERHLRPISELARLWSDRTDLMEESLRIAAKVEFHLSDIRYRYPKAKLPQKKTSFEYLSDLTEKGLGWRYPEGVPLKVRAQASRELSLIGELEYEDYFLTLYEICEFAREREILFQGRGSAASSVVCFALGLTSVDPNQIDVLFERFLSKERGEPPDIDIDFEHERREEVIQHIYQKYDEQHAGMVCTVIRYKSRLALRETAKVLGIPLAKVNQTIKYMGREGLGRLLQEKDLARRMGLTPETWGLWMHLTESLRGFPRHLGIHTGGFIITQDPITEMVPVEKASMEGRYVIQWNKDDVNTLGLMKIDVLSLGMLTALRKALQDLKRMKGLHYNLATLPKEDPATYRMITAADTVGVFQIESRAQMITLPRMKPKNFYDLVIEVALVRPGPLQGGMVHPFLRRRQGLEPVNYEVPALESVLSKTMGVPIFQEQVMRIAVVAAGFTPGEADELRRIMSAAWRRKGTMEGIRHRILEGMKKRGVRPEYADKIYQTIAGFANYGFPESHAASFALLTYASSYIKCHHPEVFLCSLLNSQPMGFYSPRILIADAQRHGVEVLPLDVNKSLWDFDYEEVKVRADRPSSTSAIETTHRSLAVRAGFRSIYGLQRRWIEGLVLERERGGPFSTLNSFIQRSGLPRTALLRLAASGALRDFQCDGQHINPRNMVWILEGMCLDESSLFWAEQRDGNKEDLSVEPPAESRWDEMSREYHSHGFSTELHPLRLLRDGIQEENLRFRKQSLVPFLTSADLSRIPTGGAVRVAGLVSVKQKPPTAKGMCFLTLEDEFGFMNIVITPDVYEKYRLAIYQKSLLEIRGTLEKKYDVTNIRASAVLPLKVEEVPRTKADRFFS